MTDQHVGVGEKLLVGEAQRLRAPERFARSRIQNAI
jgi:hypothetical protein